MRASEREPRLSPREVEVLRLVGAGKSTKEIAELLHLSVHTVCNHRKHLCHKLACHSAAELIVIAAKLDYSHLSLAPQ
jgi:DNA-binding CsgD family transcriptional regulator